MAESVRQTIRDLLQSTLETVEALLEASDAELPLPSSHVCAQGRDLWALITNDIDHEKIHAGQVCEGRYEARTTASPMERLVAEWLEERARFATALDSARSGHKRRAETRRPSTPPFLRR